MAPDLLGDVAGDGERPTLTPAGIYGRLARQPGGRNWLQYWLWLYYNPKNLFGFGKHEGDSEMVQIGLGADRIPELVTYAQHNTGEARKWSSRQPLHRDEPDRLRPVVYIAQGSHASYLQATHVPVAALPACCSSVSTIRAATVPHANTRLEPFAPVGAVAGALGEHGARNRQ